jgi:hypothetical protein
MKQLHSVILKLQNAIATLEMARSIVIIPLFLCFALLTAMTSVRAADTTYDGSWDARVNLFDVNIFASQAQQAGAGYVVMSVGQTNGYYCSPSTTFYNTTGYPPGTFCSQRDLIADMGTALHSVGIKLIVYIAATGPSSCDLQAWNGSQWVYPIQGAWGASGDASNSSLRHNLTNFITEYSQRWGTLVDGWWIDGCWVTGYGASYVDPNYSAETGPQNLNNLTLSCRAGNPNAIVALNPSSWSYTALNTLQDYIAGEDTNFGMYPLTQYVQYNGSNKQWHVCAPLAGSTSQPNLAALGNWGGTGLYYSNEYIAKYVQGVVNKNGVVTMDVGVYSNGTLAAGQLAQLQYIKSIVKDGSTGTVYADLLRYKPSYMLSNNAGNYQLGVNSFGTGLYYPISGNDGDNPNGNSATCTVPGNEWAWNYRVDISNTTQNFNAAIVAFKPLYFATNYAIQQSADAVNWTDVVTVTNNTSPGPFWYNFKNRSGANFMRLIAYAPNAPNQVGQQMAVSRFEMLSQANLALNRTARLLDNTTPGVEQSPSSGTAYASKGVDGNSGTSAIAANTYAWTYRVDLNQPTKFNQVKVTFPSSLFATRFTIDYSNDASTWYNLTTVTNNASGGVKTYNYATTYTANYIRIRALNPNGPNQAGGQMAISEFEVYFN